MAINLDQDIHQCIEEILTKSPSASSYTLRQEVKMRVHGQCQYHHLLPFYESGLINDRVDIYREIQLMLDKGYGFTLIAKLISCDRFNYLQVAQILNRLARGLNHLEQARKCKLLSFGFKTATDPDEQARIMTHLKNKGHRLTDVWQVIHDEHNGRNMTKDELVS